MKIELLKPALLTLLMVLLMVPMAYASYFIDDYDYDEDSFGNWTEAYVAGWYDGSIIHNIVHDWDWDFAQGYYGDAYHWQYPLEEYEDDTIGWTRMKIYPFKDGDAKPPVESFAVILLNSLRGMQ